MKGSQGSDAALADSLVAAMDWAASHREVNRARALARAACGLSAAGGLRVLAKVCEVASGWDGGAGSTKVLPVAKELVETGCFDAAPGGDPAGWTAMRLLLDVKTRSSGRRGGEAAAGEWGRLALAVGVRAGVSEQGKRKAFAAFASCANSGLLAKAMAAGLATAPGDGELFSRMEALLSQAYGEARSSPGKASVELDAMLGAGLEFPPLSPGRALSLLASALPLGAGRRVCEGLLARAGSAVDGRALAQLAASALGAEPKRGRKKKPPGLAGVGEAGRGLGALFKHEAWEPGQKASSALLACKAAVAAGSAPAFAAAANHCDWSALSKEASAKFGAPLLARLERDALGKCAAGPSEPAAPSRMRI